MRTEGVYIIALLLLVYPSSFRIFCNSLFYVVVVLMLIITIVIEIDNFGYTLTSGKDPGLVVYLESTKTTEHGL